MAMDRTCTCRHEHEHPWTPRTTERNNKMMASITASNVQQGEASQSGCQGVRERALQLVGRQGAEQGEEDGGGGRLGEGIER